MDKNKIDFSSLQWESPAVGLRFKAVSRAGRRLRLVEFTRNFVEHDWCLKGHIGYVLEGVMEIDFSGEKSIFRPGDGIFIEAGEKDKHKARTLTDVVKLILVEEE